MILRAQPDQAFDPRLAGAFVEADDFRLDPSYPDARTESGGAGSLISSITDK
jgi:hypothetical protein